MVSVRMRNYVFPSYQILVLQLVLSPVFRNNLHRVNISRWVTCAWRYQNKTLTCPLSEFHFNETGWDLTWLSNQIGYLEGTAYPTWSGNTGLTGHVYNSDGSAGPFVNLHLLKWGDKILLHAYGRVYTYEVRSVERVGQFDTQVLKHKNSSTLTLITCQGYDEEKDQYTWRIAVQAVLISVN